jgi:hypothetical protein
MSVDQKIIVDGHVSRQLLREFGEHPGEFDDDIVEEIWKHLDNCESCIEEYESIREGRLVGGSATSRDPSRSNGHAPVDLEFDAIDPDKLESSPATESETVETDSDAPEPADSDTPSGDPSGEFRDGHRPTNIRIETESLIDAACGKQSDKEDAGQADAEDVTDEEDSATAESETIEGLITGEVLPCREEADRLETESASDAGERLQKEKLDVDTSDESGDGEDAGETEEDAAEEEPNGTAVDRVEELEEEVAQVAIAEPEEDEAVESPKQAPEPDASAAEPDPIPAPVARPRPPRPKPSTRPKPATRPAPARAATKSEPLEDLLNKALSFFMRPRNAIIGGAAAVLIAGAIITIMSLGGNTTPSLVAGWEPLDVIETNVPLQEVLIRRIRRGRIAAATGTDVTLHFRGVDKLVIAVDLDFIKGNSSVYEVIVRDPEGTPVFQEPIPQLYVDDGRFFLRLVPKLFGAGETYKLELVSQLAGGNTRVIAESVFDVTK